MGGLGRPGISTLVPPWTENEVGPSAPGNVKVPLGMATAGYCPGTIVAEVGEGRLDALVSGLSGLIAGALVYGLLQPLIKPTLAAVGALGRVTLAELTGANPWLVLLVFVELVVLVLVLVRRVGRRA